MRFHVGREDKRGQTSINSFKVIYKDQVISFKNTCGFPKLIDIDSVFTEVNDFLSHCSELQLDALFDAYLTLKDVSLEVTPRVIRDLSLTTNKIYSAIPMASLVAWGGEYPKFTEPDLSSNNTGVVYSDSTTYDKKQYRELLIFTTALKLMFPVWGHFHDPIKRMYDITRTNLILFDILSKTPITTLNGYTRLYQYIESNRLVADVVGGGKSSISISSILTDGVTESNLVGLLIAEVISKKLLLTEATLNQVDSDRTINLVGVIHTTVKSKMEALINNIGVKVKDKPNEVNSEDEGNTSLSENYLAKTSVTDTDYAINNAFCYDFDKLIRFINPEININDAVALKVDLDERMVSNHLHVDSTKEFLLSMITFNIMFEHSISLLDRRAKINLMVIAILHFRILKLDELADYILAYPDNTERSSEISGRYLQVVKSRVDNRIRDMLATYYTKKNISPTIENTVDHVLEWIDSWFVKKVLSNYWKISNNNDVINWYPTVEFKSQLALGLYTSLNAAKNREN